MSTATKEEIETLAKDFVRDEGWEFVKFVKPPTPGPGHYEGVSIEWRMSAVVKKTDTEEQYLMKLKTASWDGGEFTISPAYTLIPM